MSEWAVLSWLRKLMQNDWNLTSSIQHVPSMSFTNFSRSAEGSGRRAETLGGA